MLAFGLLLASRFDHRVATDGGPRYTETPDVLPSPTWPAEPWNAASAALFIVLVIFWIVRLRGHYRQHPFVTCCLPLLLTGGIGGTIYHATRTSKLAFYLDWMPITLLGAAASIYLWVRLRPRAWHVLLVLGLYVALQVGAAANLPTHASINFHYASLAVLIILPVAFALLRTRFRHAGWVYTAAACFVIALFCRFADTREPPVLPMGTHWLWHTFGVLATLALSEYFYRVEGLSLSGEADVTETTPGSTPRTA